MREFECIAAVGVTDVFRRLVKKRDLNQQYSIEETEKIGLCSQSNKHTISLVVEEENRHL